MGSILQTRDGVMATVTLSNPGKMNALDAAMWRDLASIFEDLSRDTSLRCVIVRGEDGNFAAGANIAEFAEVRSNAEQGVAYHTEMVGRALESITHCIHPTVAAIEGVCVGGGLEIACACDLRIASPTARFGIPIKRLGFALAPSEMQGLVQLVGVATALEILLEGRVFDAAEAKRKGLLHRIAKNALEQARISAERIAEGAPLAARMNKQLARRLAPVPPPLTPEAFASAYAILDSADYREGVASFLANRKPLFTGQ